MRVLFYLEPWVELDFPNFRMGTIRNHLQHQIRVLIKSGFDVGLFANGSVIDEAQKQGLLDKKTVLFPVPYDIFRGEYRNYYDASISIYKEEGELASLDRLSAAINDRLGLFEPDVVIAYECASTLVRHSFPSVPVVDATLGMFSRDPFPETFCFDPYGSFRNSYLARFGRKLTSEALGKNAAKFIETLRQGYVEDGIRKINPFQASDIRRGYDKIVLLPLQVSGYFAFDGNLPAGMGVYNQFDYLVKVLERTPRSVGVCVTEHPFCPVITDRNISWLRSQFPNFIYEGSFRKHPWVSQYLIQHSDAVVTVSSAVGMQALFFDKALCVIGDSHLAGIADYSSIEDLCRADLQPTYERQGLLHWLLTRYYPLTDRYVHSGDWFARFITDVAEQHGSNDYKFSEIDREESILDNLMSAQRIPQARRRLSVSKTDAGSGEQGDKKVEKYTCLPPPTSPSVKAIKKLILGAKVVSFDIFDTLLIRNYVAASDALYRSALDSSEYLSDSGFDVSPSEYFVQRNAACRALLHRVREEGREDVSLREIMNELRKRLGLSKEQSAELRRIELRAEHSSLRRRDGVVDLYRYAMRHGKKVCLTSDMYLDEDFVRHALETNKLLGYDELFVSSTVGKLKKTGALYKHIVDHYGCKPRHVVHVGDNSRVDGEIAVRSGLKSVVIPAVRDRAGPTWAFNRTLQGTPNDIWLSAARGIGLVSRFGRECSAKSRASLFGGRAFNIGVMAAGPIALGFAHWIVEQVKKDQIDRIFFLSRDGWYVKKAYDCLRELSESLPPSTYLYASRRGCSLPALRHVEDLTDVIDMGFSEVSLGFILRERFGIDESSVTQADIQASNFETLDDEISSKNADDKLRLKRLLLRIFSRVSETAEKEREAYLDYLKHVGFVGRERVAIVDIGHNATLQRDLNKITGKAPAGYYFSTFNGARKVQDAGMIVRSYLLEFENNKTSDHYYVGNIGMFELLFIPPQKSFKRMVVSSDGAGVSRLSPEFFEYEEEVRMRVSEEVEKGVCHFLTEMKKTMGVRMLASAPDAESVCKIYKKFVTSPSYDDVCLVRGVSFADPFGGNHQRFLIHNDMFDAGLKTGKLEVKGSWWRSGAMLLDKRKRENSDALIGEYGFGFLGWRRCYSPLVRYFVGKIGGRREQQLYDLNPKEFFQSLRDSRYRVIGKILFP